MDDADFTKLIKAQEQGEGIKLFPTNKGETFTSPSLEYIKNARRGAGYDGIIVKFQAKSGTLDYLKTKALINDAEPKIVDIFGTTLPSGPTGKDWTNNNYALFKTESYTVSGGSKIYQVNIGLGKGKLLETLNSERYILNFEVVK